MNLQLDDDWTWVTYVVITQSSRGSSAGTYQKTPISKTEFGFSLDHLLPEVVSITCFTLLWKKYALCI